jgi:hypothetical protein
MQPNGVRLDGTRWDGEMRNPGAGKHSCHETGLVGIAWNRIYGVEGLVWFFQVEVRVLSPTPENPLADKGFSRVWSSWQPAVSPLRAGMQP